ncbi:MAG: glycosyltransferase family 4 protein [Gemmatimonadetes bacterium]|nr:glycosyltransferase family 4 protein [Gemmatimonadota bacterium]
MSVAFIGGRGVGGKYGGIETFYENVAPRLAARGHRVTVYCRSHFTPASHALPGVRLLRLPGLLNKHLDTPVHTTLSTAHAALSRYDVIHYHALGSSLVAWTPRLTGTRTVTTVHGLDWQRAKWGRVARGVLKAGEWASVHAPNRTVAVSRHLAAHLSGKYGRRVDAVPNGVDLVEIPPPDALARFGLEPGGYFLFAGRLSAEKGCDTLIRAHRELAGERPLVIAGGGIEKEYEAALRREASERVLFTGYVDSGTLAALYAHAFLFVLPSYMEGLSIALLEAMSYGCPVAASDIPENREVVGEAGFTFPAGDWQRLRDLLAELTADPERVRAAGEAGRRHVLATFSWERVVDGLERVYLELLDAPTPLPAAAV